jgi:mevalonate kinase
VRGVHRFFGEDIDDETLIERAFAVERVFHGNPSGVDHTTIVTGGVVAYERGSDGAPAKVSSLTLPRRVTLVVGVAGPHAGTANAVAALRERARRHPEHYARLYDGIGALARSARVHLEKGELGAVGELMDLNQGYLNALGVSTPAIEAMLKSGPRFARTLSSCGEGSCSACASAMSMTICETTACCSPGMGGGWHQPTT